MKKSCQGYLEVLGRLIHQGQVLVLILEKMKLAE